MENPLLTLRFDIPFDQITAAQVEPAVAQLLADARQQLAAIVAAPGPRTYDNTLGALERATERLEYAMGVVGHLESVATTPELRAAYNAVQPPVSEFFAGIPLDPGLWQALRAFADTAEAAALPPERARFLKKTLDDFRRHGANLDAAAKERLSAIEVELAQITTRFGQNVLDATTAFELYITEEAGLAGLPETARAAARDGAEKRGAAGWRFTLHEPSLVAVLTYLDDGAVREKLWRAANQRATDAAYDSAQRSGPLEPRSDGAEGKAPSIDRDNRPLVGRIIALRQEKAQLLGFAHFADLVLEDRMAKKGADALAFVVNLRERATPAFEKEKAELWAFRRELEGAAAPPPAPWDLAYYAEKQRKARFDFDEEQLRPYLSAERALMGLFAVAQKLYGVRIEPRPAPVWDPAVRSYAIYDEGLRDGAQEGAGTGEMLAGFYADLFPRDNKRGGAWMNGLITGAPGAAGGTRHLGLFCANVQPPVGDQPALLTHREVETLFHEFGHLLHHALSRVPVRSLAGTNVAWDFVELPSQIMENFCWERQSLDLFARHHVTGATIPAALFDKMKRARTYRAATALMRQIGFASVDLLLHMHYDPQRDGDVMAYGRRILQDHAAAPLGDDYAMLASFGHLFGSPVGYAAAYYSYKWAEVLDADAFGRFKEEGVLSPAVGGSFRAAILEQGDSKDPMDLFVAFRGRQPRLDALLERAGLAAAGPERAPER